VRRAAFSNQSVADCSDTHPSELREPSAACARLYAVTEVLEAAARVEADALTSSTLAIDAARWLDAGFSATLLAVGAAGGALFDPVAGASPLAPHLLLGLLHRFGPLRLSCWEFAPDGAYTDLLTGATSPPGAAPPPRACTALARRAEEVGSLRRLLRSSGAVWAVRSHLPRHGAPRHAQRATAFLKAQPLAGGPALHVVQVCSANAAALLALSRLLRAHTPVQGGARDSRLSASLSRCVGASSNARPYVLTRLSPDMADAADATRALRLVARGAHGAAPSAVPCVRAGAVFCSDWWEGAPGDDASAPTLCELEEASKPREAPPKGAAKKIASRCVTAPAAPRRLQAASSPGVPSWPAPARRSTQRDAAWPPSAAEDAALAVWDGTGEPPRPSRADASHASPGESGEPGGRRDEATRERERFAELYGSLVGEGALVCPAAAVAAAQSACASQAALAEVLDAAAPALDDADGAAMAAWRSRSEARARPWRVVPPGVAARAAEEAATEALNARADAATARAMAAEAQLACARAETARWKACALRAQAHAAVADEAEHREPRKQLGSPASRDAALTASIKRAHAGALSRLAAAQKAAVATAAHASASDAAVVALGAALADANTREEKQRRVADAARAELLLMRDHLATIQASDMRKRAQQAAVARVDALYGSGEQQGGAEWRGEETDGALRDATGAALDGVLVSVASMEARRVRANGLAVGELPRRREL